MALCAMRWLSQALWVSGAWTGPISEAAGSPWEATPGMGSSPVFCSPSDRSPGADPQGIPHHFRAVVWQLLCSATDMPVKNQYSELLKMSSPCEAHPQGHRPHLPRARVLQGPGQPRPGGPLQCHEGEPWPWRECSWSPAQWDPALTPCVLRAGLLAGGPGGGLLPGQRLHRWACCSCR